MNTKSMSRQDNPEYEAAWTEWLTEIDKKYLVPNQITEGGPIIMQQVGKKSHTCKIKTESDNFFFFYRK